MTGGLIMKKSGVYKEKIFVLRYWQEAEGKDWKLSIKDVNTKELKFFGYPKLLLNYLEETKRAEN